MPERSVTALWGDTDEYKAAHAFMEKRICSRWPDMTPIDLANARLKRMLLEGVFTSERKRRRRENGRMTETTYRFDPLFYMPHRKSANMTEAAEQTVTFLLDEPFPDEVTAKNTGLRPIDGHVAHAVRQMAFVEAFTRNHPDMVFAMVRMMVAEWTCWFKTPPVLLPNPTYRFV